MSLTRQDAYTTFYVDKPIWVRYNPRFLDMVSGAGVDPRVKEYFCMADYPEKAAIIKEFSINERDTGSADVQVAMLTHRINHLTGHLKIHRKDNHSRRGLILLVGQRRRLLNYISKKSYAKYQEIVKKLGLRK